MKTDTNLLPNNPILLKKVIEKKDAIIADLNKGFTKINKELAEKIAELAVVYEKFYLLQHKRYGKSSEADPRQGELFDEVEVSVTEDIPSADNKDKNSTRRNKPIRKPLSADLPREVIVHDLATADKNCIDCGNPLHKMGEDKSEKLEFIPAQVKVIEHIRPKYSCRHCDKHSTEVSIVQADVPATPIPKSFATASLLSHIIISKYQYSLPLYRQEKMFEDLGIKLSRQTMSSWLLKSSQLLTPLYNRLQHILLQQEVIQADETSLKVIKSDKNKCYMWLYCTGADSPKNNYTDIPNIVLYNFNSSRSGSCAVDFLQGYSGFLQVDGYQGYAATSATLVGCWAHARRKFKEAQIVGKTLSGEKVWGLRQIKKLYCIESLINKYSPVDKQAYRLKHSKALLDEYKVWLDEIFNKVLPKSAFGMAVAYNLNQWDKLIRYLDDGCLAIDNNRAERAIKPFVIGRKNWLFSNTTGGAQSSAVMYSIVESAKANGLIPFRYLHHVLDKLGEGGDVELDGLLPWNMRLAL